MVRGHYLQLKDCPLLFYYLQQFNIKAAMDVHPIIQKEVDELLAKDAIELLTGGVHLYSNVFVVPKCICGL